MILIRIAVKGTTKMRRRMGKEEERKGTPAAQGFFVTVNENGAVD